MKNTKISKTYWITLWHYVSTSNRTSLLSENTIIGTHKYVFLWSL